MQPKDNSGEQAGDVKSPNDVATEKIAYILDDRSFKSKIFNLDEVKGSIDIEFRGPY